MAITTNQSAGQDHYLPCATCRVRTYHKVAVSVDYENANLLGTSSHSYQIVQCQGCREFSFRKSVKNKPSKGGFFITVFDLEELYPSRLAGRSQLEDAFMLPQNVLRIYRETHAAICSKQPILGGIGIRALIETLCKEKSAAGPNLFERIDSLVTMGVLTRDGAAILHKLRILGNKAAHEVKPHEETTLGVAMDVVEHLLKTVYILPKLSEQLPDK